MRHYKKGRKLGTDASHTKAMKKSLVAALLKNDRIKTIESRAKEIRPDVDKVITWAKRGDLHSRRLAKRSQGGTPPRAPSRHPRQSRAAARLYPQGICDAAGPSRQRDG